MIELGWLTSRFSRAFYLSLPSTGMRDECCPAWLFFFFFAGVLTESYSGPRACVKSILPTETLPNPSAGKLSYAKWEIMLGIKKPAQLDTEVSDNRVPLSSSDRHGMLRGMSKNPLSRQVFWHFCRTLRPMDPALKYTRPAFLRLFEESGLISHPHGNVFPVSPVLALD